MPESGAACFFLSFAYAHSRKKHGVTAIHILFCYSHRKLLIENYRLLIALCDAFTVDHEDIDDGKKDILPSNLLYQEKKLREAYRGL